MDTKPLTDFVLVECSLKKLKSFVEELETEYKILITKQPTLSLTMLRAEDSLENQEFYLGEALTTEVEVGIENTTGIGICLGDEPQRAYCIAVMDALIQLKDDNLSKIESFLNVELEYIDLKRRIEFNQILRTRVDFKLMEQA